MGADVPTGRRQPEHGRGRRPLARAAIKKEAGVDAFADDPFAWLDYKSCNKLIEALKGYVKNAERKAGAADG